jgi:2-haloalkanoic acid dehalogenase type II
MTFDCYGTLIDWESGILGALVPWVRQQGGSATDEELLVAFAEAESQVERELPAALYPAILRVVHQRIAERLGIASSAEEAGRFAASVGDWPTFADTVPALQELKGRYRLVVVSNVDRASFSRSSEKLGVELDAVVTAEEVGAYKPDVRMFLSALAVLEEMGVGRDQVLHVAQSLYHDHKPAKELGLATAWINRRRGREGSGATPPVSGVQPDMVVASLAELVAREREERADG